MQVVKLGHHTKSVPNSFHCQKLRQHRFLKHKFCPLWMIRVNAAGRNNERQKVVMELLQQILRANWAGRLPPSNTPNNSCSNPNNRNVLSTPCLLCIENSTKSRTDLFDKSLSKFWLWVWNNSSKVVFECRPDQSPVNFTRNLFIQVME